jgi:hypothetical protein
VSRFAKSLFASSARTSVPWRASSKRWVREDIERRVEQLVLEFENSPVTT